MKLGPLLTNPHRVGGPLQGELEGLRAVRVGAYRVMSLLIDHGESVKIVQRRLGHASAAETLDTYSHLWPDSEDRKRKTTILDASHPRSKPPLTWGFMLNRLLDTLPRIAPFPGHL